MRRAQKDSATLENLVARYRRTPGDDSLRGATCELEARFRRVDFSVFATVLEALAGGESPATGEGKIHQTVNTIMPERRNQPGGGASLIRQISFEGGRKSADVDVRKRPLMPPVRVRGRGRLAYNIALSAEEPLGASRISSDKSAIARVKCRASFPAEAGGTAWRIDLTVVRELQAAGIVSSLPDVVADMFRHRRAMTPANMLSLLRLTNQSEQRRGLFAYEIEIEHAEPREAAKVTAAALTELVHKVLHLANPEYMEDAVYQAEVYYVAGLVETAPSRLARFEHEWSLKQLTPQVTALTRETYQHMYPPVGHYLLDKADGVRALASAREGRLLLLAGGQLTTLAPEDKTKLRPVVADGELVGEGKGRTFFVFDVIRVGGDNLGGLGYGDRLARVADAVDALKAYGLNAVAKPVVRITASDPAGLKAQFSSPEIAERPYGTDGRILVQDGQPYAGTRAFKWKPLRESTIDFLARRAPAELLGKAPFADGKKSQLHILFVGVNSHTFGRFRMSVLPGYGRLFGDRARTLDYFPVHFSPSFAPLAYLYQHPADAPPIDNRVVEMRCTNPAELRRGSPLPKWELVRVRDDRDRDVKAGAYFGNDFRTAELTWANYADVFTEAQLWEGPDPGYFASSKAPMYVAQTAFTSFVKSARIRKELAAGWAVDFAAGKGQDLARFRAAGVERLVAVDQDWAGLTQLVQRKYTAMRKPRHKGRRAPRDRSHAMSVIVLGADLAADHKTTADQIRGLPGFPEVGADGATVNLAIHYFAGSVVSLRNFAALCAAVLAPGKPLIVTAMFGERVHALLEENKVEPGQTWDARFEGELKYSIRRDYQGELTAAGQKIGIILPFSRGEYYSEYLVNTAALVKIFREAGLHLRTKEPFDARFAEFATRNPSMHKRLTPDDFTFLGLYGELVFVRAG